MNIKIDGIGKIKEGSYDSVSIDGVGDAGGNIETKELYINGVFGCSHSIKANSIHCDGVANLSGRISAKQVHIDGVLNCSERALLEAEEFYCDGVVNTKCEVNAERIVVDGCINAKELFGNTIKISSVVKGMNLLEFIPFLYSKKAASKVDVIEATKVSLRGVKAKRVCGHEVIIAEACEIDFVDCTGTLHIHPESRVNKYHCNDVIRD